VATGSQQAQNGINSGSRVAHAACTDKRPHRISRKTKILVTRNVIEPARAAPPESSDGGRSWWAHLQFTRTNIALTIPKNQIEELMNIKGIGEKSFLKLKPMITVGTEQADKP
jgi:hypothetical protein